MKRRVGLLMTLVLFLVGLTATGCLAWGPPTVKVVPADSINKMAKAVNSYSGSYKVPPNWVVGVVFQVYYTKSRGWHSDPYNNVRIRVYVPNGIGTIIPCNARKEEAMATAYNPGDVIAFNLPASNGTIGQQQNELYLCPEDVVLLEKNGLSRVE